jgi:cytidylate kinase
MARIAVSGQSGCGATTATKRACEALGIPLFNFTLRDLAKERGTTLEEMQKLALADESADLEVDLRQVRFALDNKDWVIGSRLAVWLDDERILSRLGAAQRPDITLKIWLDAPLSERARRIGEREGKAGKEVLAAVRKRDEENHARYLRLYGIDNTMPPKGTVVLDTAKMGKEAVAERIISLARAKK